ncbi:hypothetical protein EVAR_25282_1 [Eumeta japonica]|uniref:Uncharacterized protein n=1 Tax=Eumeta variegata TaxID=151549 RepID=A0A4C1VPG3_EUMVA|nr:hypothetical protein EVAR_25282_1 [Eumeta japonica]
MRQDAACNPPLILEVKEQIQESAVGCMLHLDARCRQASHFNLLLIIILDDSIRVSFVKLEWNSSKSEFKELFGYANFVRSTRTHRVGAGRRAPGACQLARAGARGTVKSSVLPSFWLFFKCPRIGKVINHKNNKSRVEPTVGYLSGSDAVGSKLVF